MKKNKGLAYAALAIAFVLFNVIAFVIPTAKTASFWIAYVFSAIAFASQIAVWKFAFDGADIPKSKFLGIALTAVGFTYLIIQIIAFAVFMALPLTESWIAIVVCTLILGTSAICLIGAEAGREEINRVEAKVEKKVFYLKSLQIDVEMLANTETDPEVKAELIKLAETVRFSDPMSNELLADIEKEILNKLAEFKIAEDKMAIIADLNSLITERNKKVKLLK